MKLGFLVSGLVRLGYVPQLRDACLSVCICTPSVRKVLICQKNISRDKMEYLDWSVTSNKAGRLAAPNPTSAEKGN